LEGHIAVASDNSAHGGVSNWCPLRDARIARAKAMNGADLGTKLKIPPPVGRRKGYVINVHNGSPAEPFMAFADFWALGSGPAYI